MEEFTITLADIRKAYYGSPEKMPEDPAKVEEIEYLAEVVLRLIRTMLSDEDRSLEKDILDGKLDAVLVKNLIGTVVKRSYDGASRDLGNMEGLTQVTENAPGYSMNVSIAPRDNIYFRSDEKSRVLKIGRVKWSVIVPN